MFAVGFELVSIIGLQIVADGLALFVVQREREWHLFFYNEVVDGLLNVEVQWLFFGEVV